MGAGELAGAVEDALTRDPDAAGAGVLVRVDVPGAAPWVLAHGTADRAHRIPVDERTVFGTASVAKGVTALTVMRLVEDGALQLSMPARALLGADLPLVDDAVTVEHLLSHRSGIGDYLDEDQWDDVTAHVLPVPTHTLGTIDAHLPLLDGHPQRHEPGRAFAYNNSGFVLLALLAERAAGTPFHDLADGLVLRPAGTTVAGFLRSDTPAVDAASHYLDGGLRTNVLHMPLRGAGDGGLHTTVADLHALWAAVADGRVVTEATWHDMRRPRTQPGSGTGMTERFGYGLGVWLAAEGVVFLEGYDAGISARTLHRPNDGATMTVLANTSEGAWPVARVLLDAITAPR